METKSCLFCSNVGCSDCNTHCLINDRQYFIEKQSCVVCDIVHENHIIGPSHSGSWGLNGLICLSSLCEMNCPHDGE